MVRHLAGRNVEVTEDGFLVHSDDWTPDMAGELARQSGLPSLTEEHWKVITFCREDAARQGASPGIRRIAQVSGVGMKDLYRLFPKGPGKLAARVAGLSKPAGCI